MGRPRKPNLEKKRTISISITPLEMQILDTVCVQNDVSRSALITSMIEAAGFLELGVTGATKEHIGTPRPLRTKQMGTWRVFPKTLACNPYGLEGECQNDACQAAYRKEGVV
jgi:hypothetical protein